MTLLIVLMFGLGTVLIVSAIETDPATGNSISVLQTMQDVWNNDLPSTGGSGTQTPPGHGQQPQFGNMGGSAAYDRYRSAVVQAYLQSQR